MVAPVVCEAMISGFKPRLADVIVNSTKKVVYTSSQFTMADLRKIVEDNKNVADDAKVHIRYYPSPSYSYNDSAKATIEIVEI